MQRTYTSSIVRGEKIAIMSPVRDDGSYNLISGIVDGVTDSGLTFLESLYQELDITGEVLLADIGPTVVNWRANQFDMVFSYDRKPIVEGVIDIALPEVRGS